jgi:hypothetical protein
MFDWITAITATKPNLLTWQPAKHHVQRGTDGHVTRITFTFPEDGKFGMYQDDTKHMESHRQAMLDAMNKTLMAKS